MSLKTEILDAPERNDIPGGNKSVVVFRPRHARRVVVLTHTLMFLSPLGERLGEGVQREGFLLHHPLTQPLPQGGEEHETMSMSMSMSMSMRLEAGGCETLKLQGCEAGRL